MSERERQRLGWLLMGLVAAEMLVPWLLVA
jgi:hypothetical protein